VVFEKDYTFFVHTALFVLYYLRFVQHLTFHFLQVPHFIFTVKHHERTQGNVGWLISHLEEASPSDKAAYWRKEQQ
jgi:hypothetical protein